MTSLYDNPLYYKYEFNFFDDDLPFYRSLVRGKENFLELGPGSGRLLFPLATEVNTCYAIENSLAMFEALKDRMIEECPGNIMLIPGDMRAIPLKNDCMATVIAPFNVVLHLIGEMEQRMALQEIFRIIVPGGHFACDISMPGDELLQQINLQGKAGFPLETQQMGKGLIREEKLFYNESKGILEVVIDYKENEGRKERKRLNYQQNLRFGLNLRSELGKSGFKDVRVVNIPIPQSKERDLEVNGPKLFYVATRPAGQNKILD
ncbi:class I SAM-dependent methyltransferase [Candidatus Riflebacteria bacterium]